MTIYEFPMADGIYRWLEKTMGILKYKGRLVLQVWLPYTRGCGFNG